jgi:hypothetical protein
VYNTSKLSNQIIPYQQKLQRLKEQPYKQGIFRLLVKNHFKTNFFIIVTVLLVFSIVVTSFLANSNLSKTQFKENNELLALKIKSLSSISSLDREVTLDLIKTTILKNIKPISGFTNTEVIIQNDLEKVETLSSKWLNVLDPLNEYTFSSTGFNHNTNPERNFTDDLETIFDILPQLQIETEKIWNEMWFYKIVINLSNDEKAKSAVSAIDNFVTSISNVILLKPLILKTLGHFSSQRMVIFNQNVGEARPLGGFTGSHIPLDISKGRIKLGQSQSIYYIDGSSTKFNVIHPAAWYYGFYYNQGLPFAGVSNANYTTCFPETAKDLENGFSKSNNGYSIDQLLLVNPQLIQNIIPDDLTINVPGVANITKANFLNEIERISSIEAPDIKNPKSLMGPVFKALLAEFPSIVKSKGSGAIFKSIFDSLDARDLNIWFRDQQIQDASSKLGFASEQVCESTKKTIITPLLANISGDKRGLITKNSYSISTNDVWGGKRVKISYIQNLPESKNLQRGFQDNIIINFNALQIPKNAFDLEVKSPNKLDIPFLRNNYLEEFNSHTIEEYAFTKSISSIIESSKDFPGGGFTYNQEDGSLVLGTYISDNNVGDTRVDFEFTLPMQSNERIDFFGQPGLNEPTLFLGDGLEVYKNPDIKEITDPQKIQSGITLITK